MARSGLLTDNGSVNQWHTFPCRPKLKHIQDQMQDEVKKMMSVQLRPPTSAGGRYSTRSQPLHPQRPPIIASCSPFGRMVCYFPSFLDTTTTIFQKHVITSFFLPLAEGHWDGCSDNRSEHRICVQLPETSSGSTGTIPWRLPISCIMKLAAI